MDEVRKDCGVIEVEGLTVAFEGQNALDDFSLSVEKGGKIVLEGRSGSGKSSVLKSLLGFIKPQGGRILIDGLQLDGHSVWQLRRLFGYVAQEPQMGAGRTAELLERPFSYRANSDLSFPRSKLLELCERFSFDGKLLEKDVSALSGGEKQRAAVMGALLLDRPIYLFDEPTSAMDAHSRTIFTEIIKESAFTALIVSHERILCEAADAVVRMPERRPAR